MGNPQYLDKQWQQYVMQVLSRPENIPHEVVIDIHRAFFAGASALYFIVLNGLSSGPDTTPADEKLLERIAEELHLFVDSVKAGLA